jgi:hypothetical protein
MLEGKVNVDGPEGSQDVDVLTNPKQEDILHSMKSSVYPTIGIITKEGRLHTWQRNGKDSTTDHENVAASLADEGQWAALNFYKRDGSLVSSAHLDTADLKHHRSIEHHISRLPFLTQIKGRMTEGISDDPKLPIFYRGAATSAFGKGDWNGAWVSDNPKGGAKWRSKGDTITHRYQAARPLHILDMTKGNNTIDSFLRDHPEYDEGDRESTVSNLHAFPDEQWINHVKDRGFDGHRLGGDFFIHEPHKNLKHLPGLQEGKSDNDAGLQQTIHHRIGSIEHRGKEPTAIIPHESLGIDRQDMPQIPKDRLSHFLYALSRKGVKYKQIPYRAGDMKFAQGEIGLDKTAENAKKSKEELRKKPILLSKEGYIVDGNHHAAGGLARYGPKFNMNAVQIDMPFMDILEHSKNDVNVYHKAMGEGFVPLQTWTELLEGLYDESPWGEGDANGSEQAQMFAQEARKNAKGDPHKQLDMMRKQAAPHIQKYEPVWKEAHAHLDNLGEGEIQEGLQDDFRDMLSKTTAPNGGYTYNIYSHNFPKKGYAVSPYEKRSQAISVDKLKLHDLIHFARQNHDLLKNDTHHIGTWHDPDSHKAFLDVAIVHKKPEDAEAECRAHDQKAYFDLGKKQTVMVNPNATSGGVV